MPTLATGKADPRRNGFTLIELLIVLTVIGLMSAAVVLAMPDGRGSLRAEAERFAARANAARQRAVLNAGSIAVRVDGAGYRFERREGDGWQAIDAYRWSEGTKAGISGAERIIFDSTGMTEPADILLSRDDMNITVAIGHGGEVSIDG